MTLDSEFNFSCRDGERFFRVFIVSLIILGRKRSQNIKTNNNKTHVFKNGVYSFNNHV
jgi:hypothetical protein